MHYTDQKKYLDHLYAMKAKYSQFAKDVQDAKSVENWSILLSIYHNAVKDMDDLIMEYLKIMQDQND